VLGYMYVEITCTKDSCILVSAVITLCPSKCFHRQGRRQENNIRGANERNQCTKIIRGGQTTKIPYFWVVFCIKIQGYIRNFSMLGGARAPAGPPLSPPLFIGCVDINMAVSLSFRAQKQDSCI
jgi:hypothetical protein